jgi:hypothetical protein
MSNQSVFKAFAQGHEAKGGSVRVQMFGEVAVLYSYATPIGYRLPDGPVYFDDRRYSVTTSKQQAQARREVPSADAYVLPHREFREQCKQFGFDLIGAR